MRWAGYIFLCLLAIGGLCCLVLFGIGRYMRRRCIAVGMGKPEWLHRDDEPSREPMGRLPLWMRLLDAEFKARERGTDA